MPFARIHALHRPTPSAQHPRRVPVGLVYVALSAPGVELCRCYVWQGDRSANKEQSAEAALALLQSYLLGEAFGEG